MKWNKYPEIKPPETKVTDIIWYVVLLDNNTIDNACWWQNDWYCFTNWDKIIAWKETYSV